MNRINVRKLGSREVAGCQCSHPMCAVVADVVVTPSLSDSMLMTVDRHFDCLLCGPFVSRLRVVKNVAVNVRRGSVILHPMVPAYRDQ